MRDVRQVFEIHTNTDGGPCPVCGIDLSADLGGKIDKAINHLLEHGWLLLHVGSEWARDENGRSISHTVAILERCVNPDAIADSAPRDGDIVILEHADGCMEFFNRSERVTHHDWDKMLRAAKMAARPYAVWVQRDGEKPRRLWTYKPGEII